MARVILGDTFRRIVRRGETIWPHTSHVPPKPPPVVPGDESDEPDDDDPDDDDDDGGVRKPAPKPLELL
jgi:hypothetical protein